MAVILRHSDYSGGLNDSSSSDEIERNQASLLRNWDITYKGRLYRRDGLTKQGDSLSSHEIDGLHGYLRSSGAKDLLLVHQGDLKYLNSNTWTDLDTGFTSGEKKWIETCPLNDKVYISSNSDTLHSWDRGSTTLNSCLTDLTTAPHGNVLRWHKNHMFTMNAVKVSSTTYYHRLYWSAIADPDTYDTTNDYLNIPGEGNATTMIDLGDSLVLFKEHSINFLTGWGYSSWRITATSSNTTNLDESIGCIAPRGVTRVGNEAWFIDDEGIIRRIYQTDFDAFRSDVISTNVQGTLNTINKSYLSKACAWTSNDKVYFAIATGSSTVNNTVLVFDIKAHKRTGSEAWTVYTGWTPTMFADYPSSQTVDLIVASTVGKVYKHSGLDDDGVAIHARWDGKDDDYDKPEAYKNYQEGFVTGEATADIDVGIYTSIDKGSFINLGNLNLNPGGGTLGPTGYFELGPTGTTSVLSGSDYAEFRYNFNTGGNSTNGKSVKMSIRHNTVNERPVVEGYSNVFDYYKYAN
jgi:hypothetical protein